MQVKYQLRNADKLMAFLRELPRGTITTFMNAAADYILGNATHGLRHMEPYRYVSRKAAYGRTFQSDKQRRWFFANHMQDKIGDHRTGATSAAWKVVSTNNGYGKSFRNDAPGAIWLYSENQANQLRMVGHRTITSKVMSNIDGAIRHGWAEVKKYLAAKGKK
jgi:hypothetical protein